LVDLITYKSK